MIRYNLKDRPIYFEWLCVIEVGEAQEHKPIPQTSDPYSAYLKVAADIPRGSSASSRIIRLEDNQEIPILVDEFPGIKVGDHVRYNVRTDSYELFEERLVKELDLVKSESQSLEKRFVTTTRIVHSKENKQWQILQTRR